MCPKNPTPGSRSSTTRVPSELQVTPTQELQTEYEEFQLRCRRWGTAAAKSRRACLSEFRLAVARGRSMTRTNKR
uniref:Putative inactive receptor kinase At5g58300 isoform X1 n=1 Tax=Rhizophora mucronata TaxID=61149 RepID=A0A2P2LUT7_RHIMU